MNPFTSIYHKITPALTLQNKPQTPPISPYKETLKSTINLL